MALIKCPDCGKEFSSMAEACPQCGCPVEHILQERIKCPECGMENDPAAKACSNCACPLDVTQSNTDEPSKDDGKSQSVTQNKVEEPPKDNETSQSSTSSETISPSDIQYDKIYQISEDEFEEAKLVEMQFEMKNATDINFPQPVGPHNPYWMICVKYFLDKKGSIYYLEIDQEIELALLRLLETANVSNDEYGLGVPLKGVKITIDGTETIKLDVWGQNRFVMTCEQLIKCCNAHSISFKLFRTNGMSFTVEGTEEDSQLMIDSFRGMYHYIEDKTIYIDSLVRLQRWYEKRAEELKREEQQEKAKKDAEMDEAQEKKVINITIGVVAIIVGIILILVAISFFDEAFLLTISVLLSSTLLFGGIYFISYGCLRGKGFSKNDALQKMFSNTH